jgi:hypothetical protein
MVLATAAAGCTGGDGGNREADNTPSTEDENTQMSAFEEDFPYAQDYLDNPATRRLLGSCPVTRPNHRIPPGEEGNPGAERAAYHGNGKLWTVLYGITRQIPDGVKFPWWRAVRGRLTIEGRRLDGSARAPRADIPDGYGPIGFQASRIFFPTPGCWSVTGMVGDGRLSFVTLVIEPADE